MVGEVPDSGEPADEPQTLPEATPLYIFYDCETTGLNTYQDSIVEMAAQMAPRMRVPPWTFIPAMAGGTGSVQPPPWKECERYHPE